MVKKFNNDEIFIKGLLDSKMKPAEILKKYKEKYKSLKLTYQKLNYWKSIKFNKPIVRKKKLNENEINELVEMAENKTTSIASSRKLAKDMKRKGINISKSSICNYLNERLGKPRKIKPVFALNDKNKGKRVQYCQKLIDNNIIGKDIFFTDETQIKCEYAKNKQIRLSVDNTQKLKKGDPEVLKLMERDREKFPKSIMLAGGISYYGLSDLMVVEGTMNEFAYAQAILLYKKNIEELKKINKNIIFEQDGATCHTSKANKKLLDLIFGKKGWIQNSPSSPDLAYPIETVWAELKDRVGNRNPQTYEDLKRYCIEEWNKIEPRKYFKNFEAKIKLCKEIGGERLNEFKLREIRKKAEKETEEEGKKEGNVERKLKRVFNEKVLMKLKEKEIKSLPKKQKDTAKYYDEKIKELKNQITDKEERIKYKKDFKKNTGKDLDNVNDEFELELLKIEKEKTVKTKEKKLKKIAEKIEEIPKMTIVQYLRYYLEQEEIERKKNKNRLIPEEENEEEEKEEDEIKLTKNKKVKKEENGDEENFDEETRAEIDNEMKPVLELKELLKANKKIKYDFIL